MRELCHSVPLDIVHHVVRIARSMRAKHLTSSIAKLVATSVMFSFDCQVERIGLSTLFEG